MSSLFSHQAHPRIEQRQAESPAKVAEQHRADTGYQRFNKRLAVGITTNVGTMTSAYFFAMLSLVSLPAILDMTGWIGHPFPRWMISVSLIALVAWIAQTFLQLVLLPIIIVGQNVQAEASDKRAEATYLDADAVLHEALQIQAHLEAQDAAIERILDALGARETGGGATDPPPVTPS